MATRGPATLGMRRLAIFDPTNGHQPMETPNGRHTLVFNGAIYNFQELRRELEAHEWVFRTRCDTEVLLAALVQWGEKALGRLRGMYAFAFWNSADETLLLARDTFGVKPLYYCCEGNRLAFASEITALTTSLPNGAQIDAAAITDYLSWLAVPAPRTIFRGIFCLQPGEVLKFSKGSLELRTAWNFRSTSGATPCQTRQDLVLGLRARLEDSIRAHTLADVPVGAFLSGGLDSAVVVGLMSRTTGDALRTFSIGFEEGAFSEADEAESTAKHFGAIHHTRILTGDEVAGDMENILAACDQPTGDGINTYYASQTANLAGIKVALSGLGGDELFGGYSSFRSIPTLSRWMPIWQRVPNVIRKGFTKTLRNGDTRSRKLADFLTYARDAHEIASMSRRVFSEAGRVAVLAPEALAQSANITPFHPKLDGLRPEASMDNLFSLVSAWEMRTYMADVLLRDSDVMSMRHSLELRVPFVDRPLIEWMWQQPDRLKESRRQPKSLLIDATKDILPPDLIKRRKRGFTLPFPIWMRGDLRPFLEETFSAGSVGRSGFFSVPSVRSIWTGFVAGSDNREWSRIWSLAVLVAFLNRAQTKSRPTQR